MANLISWFEIPAANLERASKFYSDILGAEARPTDFGGFKMTFLPMEGHEGVGGALVEHEEYTPSETDGVLIYLNGGDDLNHLLNKVEPAGGKVVMPKKQISEDVGYCAYFVDTEGNRIAVHSRN